MIKTINKKIAKIDRRYRFGISAVILTSLMAFSTSFYFNKALIFIPLFIIVAYALTYFSILEDIEKIEWFSLFFMPVLLSIAFYLFYFLFPGRWLTRLPFVVFYAVSIYAMLLSSNIFNVGVEKSLQLYRAAFSVNFLYHTVIVFLIFSLILSLKFIFIFNFVLSAILIFLMGIHLFWTIRLKPFIERESIMYAVFLSLILSEIVIVLSFVPLNVSIFALFIAASYYSLAGLIYTFLDQRLFKETIREYLFVWGFVFLIMVLSFNWQ